MQKKINFQAVYLTTIILVFFLILGTAILLSLKNTQDLKSILNDSVRARLISVAIAAREIIDVDKFESYNSTEDMENDIEAYNKTLGELKSLQEEVEAVYIYALKQIDDRYSFVFDTDPVTAELFGEYELCPVHEEAFSGIDAADIMNVEDKWGSFNTGSVPIFKDGKVIGIIGADFEDTFLSTSEKASRLNAIYLVASLILIFVLVFIVFNYLLNRIRRTQDELYKTANYDAVTGLPNRHFLKKYLSELISENTGNEDSNFALFFIDLDNFKKVNDCAGHDAGDELLNHIADYLSNIHECSKSFRPSPGKVSISARVGGDEFIQVYSNIKTKKEAELMAKEIITNFALHDWKHYIEKLGLGLSIGVALFGVDSNDYHTLIKCADTAMYHAKHSGKNTYAIYDKNMDENIKMKV